MAIRAKVVTITPDEAFEMVERTRRHYEKLGRPENFRPINYTYVEEIAKQIGTEDWDVNGEAIKVTDEGIVIDGGHRLAACMLANRPIVTLVIYGVDDSMTMDAGRPRTFAAYLRNMGVKRYNMVSTVVRHINCTDSSGGYDADLMWGWKSPVSLMRIYKRLTKEIMSAVDYVANHAGGGGAPRQCLIEPTILVYGCVMARRVDRTKADEFISKCITGLDITERSPVYQIRKRMQINLKATAKLRNYSVLCLLMKAWKMWLEGTPCDVLGYRDNEGAPSWDLGGTAAEEAEAPRQVKKPARAVQMSAKSKE